jgi:hypothetical protein
VRWRFLVLGCALAAAACSLLVDSDGLDGDVPPPDAGAIETTAPDSSTSNDASTEGSPTFDAGADGDDDGAVLSPYAQEVAADQPVAWFRFGEAPGAAFAKDERNAIMGAIQGVVTSGAAGAIKGDTNGAFMFNGGLIRVPRKIAFPNYSPYTLEAWIKPNALDGNYRRVMSRVVGTPGNGYAIWVHNTVGVGAERYADGSADNVYFNSLPSTTAFTHLVVVCDGATMKGYMNSVERDIDPTLTRPFLDQDGDLILGGTEFGGLTTAFFGAIDEIAIYDKALTLVRIQTHYARGIGQ